ncbi:hypothetical protein [Lentzea sp. NPDC055074]
MLSRFFNPVGGQPIPDRLPKDGWVDVPGAFRFGYPWPWQLVDGGGLVDGSGADQESHVFATLIAPHTTFVPQVQFWPQHGAFDGSGSVVRELPALYRGVVVESRKVLVGGQSAFLFALDLPGGRRVSRLVADGPRFQLHGELKVPLASAAGYEWHWCSMLGSMQWR